MTTQLSVKDVIDFPVPISKTNPKGIIEIPLEEKGINIKKHPRWFIPIYWRKNIGKMKQWTTRPDYYIDVDDSKVKYLDDLGFDITPYNEDRKQRFIDFVLAYTDIAAKSGIMANKDKYEMSDMVELGNSQTQAKYLNLARALGLLTEKGTKVKIQRPASKIEIKLAKFQAQPLIKQFERDTEHKSDISDWNGVTGNLKKALNIMDLTTEDFIAANDELSAEDAKNKKKFEAWFKERAAKKTWTADDGSKWSLDEWAASNDPNRPYFSGKGNKTTKEGDRVAQEKRSFAKAASESQQKQFKIAIKHFGEALDIIKGGKRVGSWFEMPKVILKFATLQMTAKEITKAIECLSEIKTKEQLTFSQDSVYGTIDKTEMEDTEIVEDKIPELRDAKNVIEMGKKEKVKRTEFATTQADWNDAYLYFMIGLDVGWRATEGLTATYGNTKLWNIAKDPLGEDYQTGVWEEKIFKNSDLKVMKIKFLTRKTWGLKTKAGKQRISHTEMILTPETKLLVDRRLKEIEEGMRAIDEGKLKPEQILEKYNIEQYKEVDGKTVPNYDHVLIGYDGKYVETNSVKFPSKHKLTIAQRNEKLANKETIRSVKKVSKNEEKLHAIMRECLIASGVDLNETDEDGNLIGDYWLTDSLHAIRHIFAQKWLIQSDYNYSFVAKKGHWGASQILEDAYGSKGSKQQILDNLNAAKPANSLEEKEKDEKLQLTEAEDDFVESQQTGQSDKSDWSGR